MRIGIVLSALAVVAAVPLLASALRRNGHHAPAGDGDLSAWWQQRDTLRADPGKVWLAPRVAADVREVDGTATFV